MKKLMAFLSLAVICMMFSVTSYAAEEVTVTIPNFDITLNGEKIDNVNSEYPLIVYDGITYIPMTYNLTQFMGLKTKFGDRTPLIEAQNMTFFIGNSGTRTDTLVPDVSDSPNNKPSYTALIADYDIAVNEIRVARFLDNNAEEYPILNFRDITYFPLTWKFAHESFGWDYSFDNDSGLVIDSRDAFRPVWNENYIWSSSRAWQTYYIYNDECYVGYHANTFNGQTDFIWGKRGQEEKSIDLMDELYSLNILDLDAERGRSLPSSVAPSLDGSVFSIRCVASGEGDGDDYVTYDLKIDMEKGEIISAEKVSF